MGFHKWDNARVFALARQIGCQTEDLAAYAGELKTQNVNRYLKLNRWPLPLVLHFDRLERFIAGLTSPGMQDQTTAQMICLAEGEEATGG